jgi:DNA-binding winged helix-turn-helix (wHTH) protein/tetratricopeptide (TPR) repeat protein
MQGSHSSAVQIELDLGRYELRRGGRRVNLEKKPMELLIFLVARRDQLVSREDIVARLWGSSLFIDTQPNINNIVRKIRSALGDDSSRPRFLETVVGKGYRFVGPIRVLGARNFESDFGRVSTGVFPAEKSSAWNERSSLAVLPLLLAKGVADDQGMSLGFADALASRLGNLQGMDVLPMSSVLNVPPEVRVGEAASRLGVRFVLWGGVQIFKEQWRLVIELYDSYLRTAILTRRCDLDLTRLPELADGLAKQIATTLKRPLVPLPPERHPRYTLDRLAYEEFMRGYRLSVAGEPAALDEAARLLTNAVVRDPSFSLAHAILSFVCATRHFEYDPSSMWLEKAEFHCRRALALDPDLAEGHMANAFLLWGPSKNFQHVEAIAELKRALGLQNNLLHAYNRLGTILAHIGLLDRARETYERGRPFHPKKAVSHSILQVYVWNREPESARQEVEAWRAESPQNKYPLYFVPQVAMMTGDWKEAQTSLDEALRALPEEPLIISLQGVLYALTSKAAEALQCVNKACAVAKSFGHAHHTYYQVACIFSLLGQDEAAFEWLERSVGTGFACWPFFLKDPCLHNLRALPQFQTLISSLQARYPEHLGYV